MKPVVGTRYGKLVIVDAVWKNKGWRVFVECDCSKQLSLPRSVLVHGKRTSCGCRRLANGTGSINKDGYRVVRRNGQSVLEHRVVMEQQLSRTLASIECVHHRNGDRLDNRPENLEVINRRLHSKRHREKQRQTIQRLEQLNLELRHEVAELKARLNNLN